MILTVEQAKFLEVLGEPHFLTMEQALKVLRGINPDKREFHLDRMLKRLQYYGKLYVHEGVVYETGLTLPGKARYEPDSAMCLAVDIMLDLSKGKIRSCAARQPPFLLKFLCGEEQPASYGVVDVPDGKMAEIQMRMEKRTTRPPQITIFLLKDLSQRDLLHTGFKHYFAVPENGNIRYFRGGTAGENST